MRLAKTLFMPTLVILLVTPWHAMASGVIAINPENQQLIVTGTPDDDTVVISNFNASQIVVSLVTGNNRQAQLFDNIEFNSIFISTGAGNDNIRNNTTFPITANSGSGNDIIIGGNGSSNTLLGGPGNDVLVGGVGNDTLYGEGGEDTLLGNDGNDTLYGGFDSDIINGGTGNDVLLGEGGDDEIDGEDGDDIINGGDDNDLIFAGSGNDNIKGGWGNDIIDGGNDDDTIDGDEDDDTLIGGLGNDNLFGSDGDDVIRGNAGTDTLDGGLGADILAGDFGNDVLKGGDGNDKLDGGFGWDVLFGGDGDDVLIGGTERDILHGEQGDDFLMGNRGIDSLYGYTGNDVLRGDIADDVLDGGDGINKITTGTTSNVTFGVVSNPANDPNHTDDDKLEALEKAASLADQISLFWSFSQQADLPGRLQLIPVIHDLGKKSLIQIQSQFVGDPSPPFGMNKTFADPDVRDLYLDNIRQISELHPTIMNLTPEVNFLYYFNPDEFTLFVTLYKEAYTLIKSISPETKVGVSYQYLFFQGFEQTEAVEQLSPHDYVAFTTYPIWMLDAGIISSPADISPDYYTWARDTYPDEIIIFSEVGWPNFGTSSPQMQADYIRRLPELMAGVDAESINWTLLNNFNFFHPGLLTPNVTTFLLEHGVDPVLLFDRLNNVGLHKGDGTPQLGWFEAMQLNFSQEAPLSPLEQQSEAD